MLLQDVVAYLLKQGADPNMGGKDRWRPVHAAVYNDSLAMCKLLLKYKPIYLNAQCKELNMYTPLQIAIATSDPIIDIVACMLSNSADPNIMTQTGSTALHIAAHYGHEKIVQMLVKSGAKLGLKNAKGKMPVEVAANYGYKKIVEYLSKKQGIRAPSLKKKVPKFKASSKPEKPSADS